MVGSATFAVPAPLRSDALVVVNPAPLRLTAKAPAGIVLSAVRAVMLTLCTPFSAAPVGEIDRVPSSGDVTVTTADSEAAVPATVPTAKKVYVPVELGSVSVLENGVVSVCVEKLAFAKSLLLSVTVAPEGLELTLTVTVSPGSPLLLDSEIVMGSACWFCWFCCCC